MRAVFLFIGLCCCGAVSAQQAAEVLKNMQALYGGDAHYSCKCTYEQLKGQQVTAGYKGSVYRQGSSLQQRTDQAEYIYASDFFLEIDHQNKTAILGNARALAAAPVDVESALRECEKVEMERKGTVYIVTLTIKQASAFPFSEVRMRIDAKQYYLEEIDFFYAPVADLSMEKTEQDHLRITFSDLKLDPKPQKALFNLTTYTRTGDSGLLPSGVIAGYTFSDNRIN